MLRSLLIFSLMWASGEVYGQFLNDFSGSLETHLTYFTDDDKVSNPGTEDLRSNNYLQLNYLKNQWSASVQFESYFEEALLGYSPNLDQSFGLSMLSLSYQFKDMRITAGYFFDQFGSGMIFRSWEDRQLGLNNALIGGRLNYRFTNKFQVGLLMGKQKIAFDISDGTLIGMLAEYRLNSNLTFEASYLGRHQSLESENPDFSELTNSFSGGLKYQNQNFYSNLELVFKSKDALVEFGNVIDSRVFDGNAILLNIGYFKSGLGIDASFRRLENMLFYTDREKYNNIYNESIINYLPALTKQHSFGLANIYVYQAQAGLSFLNEGKSGEIGQQIDVFYRFTKENSLAEKFKTVISFNYSGWFGLKATYDLEERAYDADFLQYGEKYYQDINFEIKNQWTNSWRSRLFYMRQFYNLEKLQAATGTVNASILALESKHSVSKSDEVRIQIEHLWTKDDQKNWVGGLLEYHLKRKFSFYISDQYNYGNNDETDKIHYYNIGGAYRNRKTKINLNYGRQRGGLICVGGICRFVPRSNGLTLSLNLYL